jgi:hypothetical protein
MFDSGDEKTRWKIGEGRESDEEELKKEKKL